ELAPTDATDASIAAIASSPIREIVVVGRRGPAQAAFTTPELQEMGELAGADVVVEPADLEGAEPHGTNAARNVAVLQELAARAPDGKPRRVVFRFFESPVAILGEEHVEGIELVRNQLDADERAVPTDERETLPCGLVFRSVGYHGVELPGVPFDAVERAAGEKAGRPRVKLCTWDGLIAAAGRITASR